LPIGSQFFKDFLADWEQHGPQVIAKMRNERPDLYLKVAASIVPKDLHITSQGVADMSDEQVLRIIDAVRALVAEQGLPQLELQAQSPPPRSGDRSSNALIGRERQSSESQQALPPNVIA
jgi:hypothetical protein